MNFLRTEFIPAILIAFTVLIITVLWMERKFFATIKTYWFYKRSWSSVISTFFFICGMGLLLFSLLDLRGPEEKIKTEAPTERTIILIDTSASMLAEDVKPSRLQKAVLIAKHYARKATGHQIAVVVFAEIQKKIVPFTNDLDLIDARLETLKNLKNNYGSSALSVAIQESVQYFREPDSNGRGNLLVLTDGEETAEGVKLKLPADINLALVGIGTEQGGRIPLDDGRGLRYGYKKTGGKDVVTKLNETFFQKTAEDVPSGKYWLANSYTLPSDEIVDFFRGEMQKGQNQQDMTIRPVLMEWVVLPAILLFVLSYAFKVAGVFTLGLLVCLNTGWAQDGDEKKIEFSPETLSRLDQLQRGELTQLEKIKLADEMHKAGALDESLQLYQENLPPGPIDPSLPPEAYLNYGTGLLQKKQTAQGLQVYSELAKAQATSESGKKINEIIKKNTMSHFRQIEEEKKKKEQEKKDKEKNKGQDKNQGNDQGQNSNQGDPKGQGNSGQNQTQQKPGDKGQEDKKDQNGKDKEDKGEDGKDKKNDDGKDGDKDKESKPQDGENDGEKKPLPPRKMPAKLKQLMSDDRQLQMKVIENGTKELNQRKNRNSKDW
jgi:Ca-activated chloride channel homolog